MIHDTESSIIRELDGGIKANHKQLHEIGRILCDLDWYQKLLLWSRLMNAFDFAVC
jgi:hypothetical protein